MKRRVRIRDSGQLVELAPDASLLEALIDAKIAIDHSCEGMGSCGTCRIYICAGEHNLLAANEIEQEMRKMRNFEANERLSCQLEFSGEIEIRLPEPSSSLSERD